MGTRAELVKALREAIPTPAAIRVIDQPRTPDMSDASVAAFVVVERVNIKPAPNVQGSYLEEHHLWVVTPSTDIDTLEDGLDAALDVVLEVIATMPGLSFDDATRSAFADTYHAYDLTLTIVSTKE